MPTEELGERLVHWEAQGDAPILYLHGVPNASPMWAPFLERSGGVAVDLPGFGRSGKGGHLDYSFRALGAFVGELVERLGWERVRLCVHDWGAVGLLWAMEHPERVERLVVLDAVPFLPGYRWHVLARQWRRRGVGELAMGFTTRPVARRLLPEGMADEVLPAFDVGTQRAILRLYRSASEDELARAGERMGAISCPALIAWGERDPYIPASFAEGYSSALSGENAVRVVPGAGHWPWLDDRELVTGVTDFLVR